MKSCDQVIKYELSYIGLCVGTHCKIANGHVKINSIEWLNCQYTKVQQQKKKKETERTVTKESRTFCNMHYSSYI